MADRESAGNYRYFLPIGTRWMDNDVYGTDYCIGFSTAVTRSVQFIHQLRTSTGSPATCAACEHAAMNGVGRHSAAAARPSASRSVATTRA